MPSFVVEGHQLLAQKGHVPAWSHEIGNVFIKLALADGTAFTQMQLQGLVYIAHGWTLLSTDQPMTGDRPEALAYGAEYRRLADALASWGIEPVTSEIKLDWTEEELSPSEREFLLRIHREYGDLRSSQLQLLTSVPGTPWEQVYAAGAGAGKEISHLLVKEQFAKLDATFKR